MKRIIPLHVRVASLLIAASITALIVGIHAVDLTLLGVPDDIVRPVATTVVATSRPIPPPVSDRLGDVDCGDRVRGR